MSRTDKTLAWCFAVVMLVFTLFMIWFIPNRASRTFQLEDVARSVETSHGRERKQQAEYDEAAAELPLTQAELKKVQPEAEAAKKTLDDLKAERKRLRMEKQALEEKLNPAAETDGN